MAKQCFENLGKTVVEFMQFPRLDSKQIQRYVTFEGTEHVQQALAHGKGAIILTGHFGNWELLAASISATIAPLTPIVRELRSPRLNALVSSYREKAGYATIDRDTDVRPALRCLKRNELLGIVADVDTAVSGVFVDFFGRHAYTPYSPVAIALKTGASILPTFIIRQPDGSHHAIIEPPLALKRTHAKEKDLVVNTQTFTKIIESYIRRYPTQWIWMHRRWNTQP
jgi:KDO2-lipid IV(A) lauroyltransferase